MTTASTSLVDVLRKCRLLEPTQLEEVTLRLQVGFPDPKALTDELIRRGWLSPYQANQLLQGRGTELLLGSYVLQDRLGEGGMGTVFKAKNWKLGRTVAIKLIRKERLDNPNAVRRFRREVRAAAALNHPNVVLAHDADEIGGTHLLVMEYVEGAIDLSRLVKQTGPLPLSQACDYVRQAALGLQHAFEKGMVHRDIKPQNLLLAGGKVVKVLDLGLARLDHQGSFEESSTEPREGALMGTPDYIAPEQAMESHTVDIRADLYSLGCTFYFLLTGRVPFPGGTLLQKLNKHQNEAPRPVEQFRHDVPPAVARVVRKLMAKRPEDRFQTPAELVVALEGVASAGSPEDRPVAEGRSGGASAEASRDTVASPFSDLTGESTCVMASSDKKKGGGWRLPVAVAGGCLVVLGVILFLVLKQPARKEGDRTSASATPAHTRPRQVDDSWLKEVAALPAAKQVEAVAAKLMELNPDFDSKVSHKIEGGVVTELQFLTDQVTDISPVRALPGLRRLDCHGTLLGRYSTGQLADLWPLKDMNLVSLSCWGTQVGDDALAAIKGCRTLTYLDLGSTRVSDDGLAKLKGCKNLTTLGLWGTQVGDSGLAAIKECKNLAYLDLAGTKVSDDGLAHIKECQKLTMLYLSNTQVSDLGLARLKDCMNLRGLSLTGTKVNDLSLLKGMPLKELDCNFKAERDTKILRSLTTLETINGKPVKEFWKEAEAKKR